jgi:hypothetical protein
MCQSVHCVNEEAKVRHPPPLKKYKYDLSCTVLVIVSQVGVYESVLVPRSRICPWSRPYLASAVLPATNQT